MSIIKIHFVVLFLIGGLLVFSGCSSLDQPCKKHEDCEWGYFCRNDQLCKPGCRYSIECKAGEVCQGFQCIKAQNDQDEDGFPAPLDCDDTNRLVNPAEKEICDNKKLIDLRIGLIGEEYKEFIEAVKNKDIVEVYDALLDILYVVHGTGASFGLNLDTGFDLVHKSNMSKLCRTEEEAIKTVEWYKEQYINKKLTYDSPAYKKSKGGEYWIVFNQSTGKILKSINYKPVDLKYILK